MSEPRPIKALATSTINGFEQIKRKRDGKTIFIYEPGDAFENHIMECHKQAGRLVLPSDFIFEHIYHCLRAIIDWEIESESELEDSLGEMVDGITPINTHDLINHFHEFPDYAEAAKIDNLPSDASILTCIQMGCYLHIDELMTSTWEWLVSNAGEE